MVVQKIVARHPLKVMASVGRFDLQLETGVRQPAPGSFVRFYNVEADELRAVLMELGRIAAVTAGDDEAMRANLDEWIRLKIGVPPHPEG